MIKGLWSFPGGKGKEASFRGRLGPVHSVSPMGTKDPGLIVLEGGWAQEFGSRKLSHRQRHLPASKQTIGVKKSITEAPLPRRALFG